MVKYVVYFVSYFEEVKIFFCYQTRNKGADALSEQAYKYAWL